MALLWGLLVLAVMFAIVGGAAVTAGCSCSWSSPGATFTEAPSSSP